MNKTVQQNVSILCVAAFIMGMSVVAEANSTAAKNPGHQNSQGVGSQASLQSAKKSYKNKEFQAALSEFKELATAGNAEAQFYLGLMYDNSEGMVQDYQQTITHVEQAMTWYRKAAEQGYAPAQTNLGIILETGGRVERNYQEAASWYRKAAAQGDSAAQFNLGIIYYSGRGDDIAPDYKEAAIWLGKAAEQGNSAAQIALGRMYEYGQGVPVNYGLAHQLYLEAAAAGNESAQVNKESVEAKMTPEQLHEVTPGAKKKVAGQP